MSKGKGWHGESKRHALSRKGVKTGSKEPKTEYIPPKIEKRPKFKYSIEDLPKDNYIDLEPEDMIKTSEGRYVHSADFADPEDFYETYKEPAYDEKGRLMGFDLDIGYNEYGEAEVIGGKYVKSKKLPFSSDEIDIFETPEGPVAVRHASSDKPEIDPFGHHETQKINKEIKKFKTRLSETNSERRKDEIQGEIEYLKEYKKQLAKKGKPSKPKIGKPDKPEKPRSKGSGPNLLNFAKGEY